MFPAGTFDYSISNGVLNFRIDGSSGIDFDHVSGKRNDVYGTWEAVDDDLAVTFHINETSIKVVSDC